MLKSKHGWSGNYRWGRDNRWSNDAWDYNALHSTIWGPTVLGLSFLNGIAFAKIQGATLAAYTGTAGTSTPYKLVLHDSAGVAASGFIANADAAEGLDTDLVTVGNFASDNIAWVKGTGWSIGSGVATKGAGAGVLIEQDISAVANTLYKIVFDLTRTAGTFWPSFGSTTAIAVLAASATYTYYVNCGGTDSKITFNNDSAFRGTLDNVVVQQVLHVGATGNHIVSAKAGSTRNWTSIGTGFNYNSSAYRAEIRRA